MNRLICVLSLWFGLSSAVIAQQQPTDPPPSVEDQRCSADPRVRLGQVSHMTCVGAEVFFRNTFEGNGRTCSSCHPAANNYTLDPDFIATLPDDDPLFIAELDPELQSLEIPKLMRDHALIVVNADGFEDPTKKFVVRSVQHLLGLSMTVASPPPDPTGPRWTMDGTFSGVPAQRLGWSGDGAPGFGTLRDFADGAIRQHATRTLQREEGVDFVLPNDRQRDALSTFTRRIGRMNDLDLERVVLGDAAAERGRVTFQSGAGRECSFRCHNGAGANTEFRDVTGDVFLGRGNATLDIGTPLVRLADVDALGIGIDGGFGKGPLDSTGDGVIDSFGNGGMNVPSLIEAADTAPLFHTNFANTLEDAIRFYTTPAFANSLVGFNPFFDVRKRLEPMTLSEQEIVEMGRFLRVLNVALNLQMASRRLQAAAQLVDAYEDEATDVVRGLAQLAAAELEDAAQVLEDAPQHALHPEAQRWIEKSRHVVQRVVRPGAKHPVRSWKLNLARAACDEAYRSLGTGLTMQIGEGTLMF